ncbi:MAG: MgtC/SapB family protein [Lachnospiraceae bacterium]|nr:MgtC/SapB family protein [Lachnospiraceae bacterium]
MPDGGAKQPGGLIGLERGRKGRPAGFRTHVLICIRKCCS